MINVDAIPIACEALAHPALILILSPFKRRCVAKFIEAEDVTPLKKLPGSNIHVSFSSLKIFKPATPSAFPSEPNIIPTSFDLKYSSVIPAC